MSSPRVANPFRLFSLVVVLAMALPAAALAGAVTQLTTNTSSETNTDAAIDVLDNVHVVYERDGNIYYRGRTGTTWSTEELVAAGTGPAVSAGPSGVPQVAFASGTEVRLTARVGGTWTAPVQIGVGSSVDLAVDGSEVAHVVYLGNHYGDPYPDIIYKNNSSGTFPAEPILIWNSTFEYGLGNYYHEVPPVIAADAAGHFAIGFRYKNYMAPDWVTILYVYRSATNDAVGSPEWYRVAYPPPQRNGLVLADGGTAFMVYGTTMAVVQGPAGAGTWTPSPLPAGSSFTLDPSPAPALHLAYVNPTGGINYAVDDTGTGFGTPVVLDPTTSGRNPIAVAQTDPFVAYEAVDSGDYEVWFARTANQAPVFDAIGDKTVNEGETLSFTVHASDADGDELQYGGSNMPMNTTLDPYTGEFTFTPDFTQAGSYTTVTFQVSDGTDTDEETITIDVNQVNAPPVLGAVGDKSVDENATLSFTLTATDIDNDELTFGAQNLPTGATLDPSSGAFSWTPTYDQAGSYPGIIFTVTDNGTPNLSDSETITITVNDVNRDPVLAPIGDQSVDEGATLTFVVSANDDDGDTLTYGASNLPTGATFDPATRTFSWTPAYEQAGSYPGVGFTATDDGSPNLNDSETITITVNPVNAPPVLAPIGDRSASENANLSFTVSATDVDGDTLTYSASGLPTGATFDPGTRTFSWTPGYDQAGAHTGVVFTVTDDGTPGKNDSETITITVDNVNRAPVLDAIGDKSVMEGDALSFTVSATDEDGETLTYGASNLPTGATFDPATRSFSWTPAYDQAGDYAAVVFNVADAAASDAESITITVTDNPTPPGFFTVMPCRVIDTRNAAGEYGGPALVAGTDRTFDIVGSPCGIPATATAISVNVTVTEATAPGNLRLYPAGVLLPGVSTINYVVGQTRANNAIVRLSELGELAVRCAPAGTAHFILDVNGYFQEEDVED